MATKPKKAVEPTPAPTPDPAPTFLQHLLVALLTRWQAFYAVVLAPLGLRTLLLGGLAALLLARDTIAAKSFLMPFGLVCAVLAFVGWYRKAHMPYLDQQVMVTKAEEDPLAAAIVYAATRAFDAAVMLFILFAAVR